MITAQKIQLDEETAKILGLSEGVEQHTKQVRLAEVAKELYKLGCLDAINNTTNIVFYKNSDPYFSGHAAGIKFVKQQKEYANLTYKKEEVNNEG